MLPMTQKHQISKIAKQYYLHVVPPIDLLPVSHLKYKKRVNNKDLSIKQLPWRIILQIVH